MSRHTSTLARALALCLVFAGMVPVTRAQPLSSAEPQASPAIILAQQVDPDAPRRVKCARWVDNGHGKRVCQSWCYSRHELC